MRLLSHLSTATALALSLGSWPVATRADEQAKSEPAVVAKSEAAKPQNAKAEISANDARSGHRVGNILRTLATAGEIPAELRDPAFDRYVDLTLLGSAWADLDAALITDVALQFLDGERVLLRTHRVIGADDLLRIATRMAGLKRDAQTLSRLEKVIKPRGNAALLAQLSEAQKELSEPKPIDPAQQVSVDAMTSEAFVVYKGCLKDIEAALVGSDASALATIEKELPGFTGLSSECQTKLKSKLDETKLALTHQEQPVIQVAGLLDKLAGATRNPNANLLPEGSGILIPGGEIPTIPGGGSEGTPGGGEGTIPGGGSSGGGWPGGGWPGGRWPGGGEWGGGGSGGGEYGGGGGGGYGRIPGWWPPRPYPQQQQQQQWIPTKTPPPPPPPPSKYTPGKYPGGYPRRYDVSSGW